MNDLAVPFLHRLRAEFADTDMAGIVHFANLLRYMEAGEHAFLRALGLSVFLEHEGRSLSFPRTKVTCEFHSPVRFEDEVDVRVWIKELGKKSLTFGFELSVGDRPAARGEIVAVCCQIEPAGKIRSIPIPEPIAAKLRRGVVAPAAD